MDKMDLKSLFNKVYLNRKVLITGHTGFKGSWLSLWLSEMGALVKGYALMPTSTPSHWILLNCNLDSIYGDIRHRKKLEKEISEFSPEIVFHLAAQPIIRASYINPIYTYETNLIGTLNLLEACRKSKKIKAIVIITSDKCYENKEWVYGYRETDPMGGFDPYSSSKGCVELLISSYRNSYFNLAEFKNLHNTLLASVRAGNTIGGGDWAKDRLIPDIIRATIKGKTVNIRNPSSLRPWQHVLDTLSGYLLLGQKLLEEHKEYAESWNFGPKENYNLSVKEIAEKSKEEWEAISFDIDENENQPHEAKYLKLDCSKAQSLLGWFNVWNPEMAIDKTINWYKAFYENDEVLSYNDLVTYVEESKKQRLCWTR